MSAQGKATSFLDLPPELRNKIYDISFETKATSQEVDLFATHAVAPPTALAATCRQLRSETLTILREAQELFIDTHTFYLTMTLEDLANGSAYGGLPPSALQTILDKVPASNLLLIRRFTVRVLAAYMSCGVIKPHVWRDVVFTAAEDGQVMVESANDSAGPDLGRHIYDCAVSCGIRLSQVEDPRYLDLYGVVRAVLENYGWIVPKRSPAWTANLIDEVLAALEDDEDDDSEDGNEAV
ncbi:hypothetical protein LTR36_004651 [Oleoguttula mirabilis]|uniref:Uncharacterized protein n=1 Tax=Oleoguttula mirabilis TaxID=1507867 RepID=A0AAV9JEY8_9PEZI|nr:hypothetical protein LTR36_004651 [Oleoguttula mirabilis]